MNALMELLCVIRYAPIPKDLIPAVAMLVTLLMQMAMDAMVCHNTCIHIQYPNWVSKVIPILIFTI